MNEPSPTSYTSTSLCSNTRVLSEVSAGAAGRRETRHKAKQGQPKALLSRGRSDPTKHI